jgi:hypothetical protein
VSTPLQVEVEIDFRPGERMVIKDKVGQPKIRRRRIYSLSEGIAGEWGVHNNDLENLRRAIVERVFCYKGPDGVYRRPPQPTTNVKRRLREFRRLFLHNLEEVVPISTKEFVEHYVGRKRKLYERVVEDLKLRPLCKYDAYINAFIKDEKTDFKSKPDKCPRIIQPRSPRFNASVGVYLRPLEKAAFRSIAAIFRGVTVAKGLNCFQRGQLMHEKWSKFIDPVALEIDAAKFDVHCSRVILDEVYDVENEVFPTMKKFNDLRRRNKCFARTDDGDIEYEVEGNLMSGDMDTSFTACYIMCALVWTIMKELGIDFYEYINDGDDGTVMIERKDLARVRELFQSKFLEFGIQVRIDGVKDTLESIEFCQTHAVYDGRNWRMVRDPRKALAKDSLTLRNVRDNEHLQQLQNAMGWCGLSLAGDLPVFNAFYRHLAVGDYEEIKEYTTGMQFLAHGLDPRLDPVTETARLSFYRAFSISPDTQLAIESHISTFKQLQYCNPTPSAFNAHNEILQQLIEAN